jgi:hypothetical protein
MAGGSKMNSTYSFDQRGRDLRLTFTGECIASEWIALMEGIIHDPRFRPGLCVLADRTRATAPTTSELRQIVEFTRANAGVFLGIHWAIVVPDPVSYGMARMAQALLDPVKIGFEILHEVGQAERWLDAQRRSGPSA